MWLWIKIETKQNLGTWQKKKSPRLSQNSRAEGRDVELSLAGFWRLLGDLALIKARLPRIRQLDGCVYMHRLTLLLALLFVDVLLYVHLHTLVGLCTMSDLHIWKSKINGAG